MVKITTVRITASPPSFPEQKRIPLCFLARPFALRNGQSQGDEPAGPLRQAFVHDLDLLLRGVFPDLAQED